MKQIKPGTRPNKRRQGEKQGRLWGRGNSRPTPKEQTHVTLIMDTKSKPTANRKQRKISIQIWKQPRHQPGDKAAMQEKRSCRKPIAVSQPSLSDVASTYRSHRAKQRTLGDAINQ
ncbi:hypothetical protein ASPBRDRAFT_311259 [Aspergillus brasiliensis CBS 101740]|uniref:Uncharacterized protein n=1 Tax=Aspergillus brasiliensis (strain CBS 101740 / IMI 381727 / IBT 21946) TaxID=767769 RepID=A0A1L9UAJ7_ASPBC|nr:hypothetical protein ASPBRDRAFT_311259 [Aspergillus brasiliensis CBS 101740]